MVTLPHEIATPRLVLRAPTPEYADEVNAALVESMDALRPWMDCVYPAPTVADTAAYLERARDDFAAGRGFAFAAFRRTGGRFAAMVALETIDWAEARADLGYWIRTSEAGRGFTTEALDALLTVGFSTLGLRRVEARIAAGNAGSRRVAEKLGFAAAAAGRREGSRPDGTPDALLLFVRTAPHLSRTPGVPMHRSERWSLDPAEWTAEEGDPTTTFVSPDRSAALGVTTFERTAGDVPDDELARLSALGSPATARREPVRCGDFAGYCTQYEEDGTHWRVWWLARGPVHLYVTYACGPDAAGRDDALVDRMLGTLRAED